MIHRDIAAHLPAIRQLCRTFGVKHLELFGSAVRGDFRPDCSDVDFLIEWDHRDPPGLPERWWRLSQALTDLLGRKVDLVAHGSIRNSRLRQAIDGSLREVIV